MIFLRVKHSHSYVLMTNEIHRFLLSVFYSTFLSALHVSNQSSRSSSGARHNICITQYNRQNRTIVLVINTLQYVVRYTQRQIIRIVFGKNVIVPGESSFSPRLAHFLFIPSSTIQTFFLNSFCSSTLFASRVTAPKYFRSYDSSGWCVGTKKKIKTFPLCHTGDGPTGNRTQSCLASKCVFMIIFC